MPVLVTDVAEELGRPASSTLQEAQWQRWIARAYRLIEDRFGERFGDLDPILVDEVVLDAVVAYVRSWRETAETRTTVAVDDGSVSRTYERDAGPFRLSDALWARLDPSLASGAFSVRPSFVPDLPTWPLEWP